MSKRCGFCRTTMEIKESGGVGDIFLCPVCGYQDLYGPYRLPQPEQLRDRADELMELADQLESSPLASALRRCLG